MDEKCRGTDSLAWAVLITATLGAFTLLLIGSLVCVVWIACQIAANLAGVVLTGLGKSAEAYAFLLNSFIDLVVWLVKTFLPFLRDC